MRLDLCLITSLFLLPVSGPAQVLLYSGGEYDFESGFKLHVPSIFADKPWDQVGNGWGYWGQPALFQPPQHRYGHPSFNGNQFSPNVSHGWNSQEITLTSANGDGIIWRNFAVTPGHTIRVEFDAITTPSEDMLQLRHALGQGPPIDFFGQNVTDPFSAGLDWVAWNIMDTNNHFGTYSLTVEATAPTMTYYFWVRHTWATASGATLCCDNLRVTDLSVAPPPTPTPTATPLPEEPGMLQVR